MKDKTWKRNKKQPNMLNLSMRMVQVLFFNFSIFISKGTSRRVRCYDLDECIACTSRKPAVIFECGHLVYCFCCKRAALRAGLTSCPVCKREVPSFDSVRVNRR